MRSAQGHVQLRGCYILRAFRSMCSWVAFQSRPTARALSDSSWNALWQQVCLDFSACVPHSGISVDKGHPLLVVHLQSSLLASSPPQSHQSSSVPRCLCGLHA